MNKIFFTIFFFILSAFIMSTNSAYAAQVSTGGVKQCVTCERKEGQKAFLIFDGFSNKCSYVQNGSDCNGEGSCYSERTDPTLSGNNGICSSGQSCSEDVYTGCVSGSPGPSCTISSNSCSQSSGTPNQGGCQLSNACTNYYCVAYKGPNPYEVTLGYSNSEGIKGICEKLDTRPPLASSSGPGSSLIKDSATTIVGSGTSSGDIGEKPIECEGTIVQCLKDEFNVTLQGNYSNTDRDDIFRIFSEVGGKYPKYKTLLKNSGPTPIVFVNDASKGGGCPARVQPLGGGRSEMTLWNYDLSACSKSTRTSRIIHESGHVLRNGHMRLFQLFESRGYNKDPGCYYATSFTPRYFIKTYDTSFASSVGLSPSGSNETMAEFLALTVIPEDRYPEKCPVGYRWVRENIFGI